MLEKILLIAHAAASVVLIGSSAHNARLAVYFLRGGASRLAASRRFSTIVFWSYLAVFIIGIIIYPEFRVDVRAAYFDQSLPAATGFFEIKEHLLALGLALVFWLKIAGPNIDPRQKNGQAIFHNLAVIFIAASVIYGALVGLALTILKSI